MQYLTHFRSGSIKLVIFCRTTYSMSLESTKLKSRTSESSCSAKEIEINAPETAVHDQENGNGNGQQSGTVSKWVDPGKETKSTMEQDTRVNSVGRFYCCIVWRSQNFNSPTSNTVSHFKIVPLWLFYLLHVSFTRNSAVHRLRRKISTVFQLRLRRVDLKDWSHEKRHVSFPHKIDRYARVSKLRHSALNKWWIFSKNDCLPLAKSLSPHCSFKRVLLTLETLRSRPFLTNNKHWHEVR